jgi:hypothetical protein
MKTLTLIVVVLTLAIPCSGQSTPAPHSLVKADEGLYHLYYDSSPAKSTVVEFKKFIVLLEVPIKNEGGGATNLKDHVAGGEKVLALLKENFPGKPLKYVMHTHWHPHSLSAIKPFITNGVTLVSTRTNFEKLQPMVDPITLQRHRDMIKFVDGDSMIIEDKGNTIIAYRFLQKEFQSTPTPEYLYFYLPRYKALHSGCMYFRVPGKVEGREVVTDRVTDLHRFLETKHLQPACFIRYNGDKETPQGLLPYSTFQEIVANGIAPKEITAKYLSASEEILTLRRDSVLAVMIANRIPVSMVNTEVYACLRKGDLKRALSLAQLQVMLNPADPNAWDTLGEAYYFLDQKEMASYYEKQSKRVSSAFQAGGEKVWQADLETYRKNWK